MRYKLVSQEEYKNTGKTGRIFDTLEQVEIILFRALNESVKGWRVWEKDEVLFMQPRQLDIHEGYFVLEVLR